MRWEIKFKQVGRRDSTTLNVYRKSPELFHEEITTQKRNIASRLKRGKGERSFVVRLWTNHSFLPCLPTFPWLSCLPAFLPLRFSHCLPPHNHGQVSRAMPWVMLQDDSQPA